MEITGVDNGFGDIDSVLLEPIAVTKDNIADTVVADGFWSVEDILTTPELEAAGAEVGLTLE